MFNREVSEVQKQLRENSSKEVIFYVGNLTAFQVTVFNRFQAKGTSQGISLDSSQGKIEKQIIEFCREPKSLSEISEVFGFQNRRKFREKFINPLIKSGLLKRTIPDKPRSGNQKYISGEQVKD